MSRQFYKCLIVVSLFVVFSSANILFATEIKSGSIQVSGTHDDATLRALASEAEALLKTHATFLSEVGVPNNGTRPLKITLLTSSAEYESYKLQSRTKSESPRGYYEHDLQQIVTWEDAHAGFSSEVRRVLAHETFHHQLHSSLGNSIPLWLDEGLAVLFENSVNSEVTRNAIHQAALSQVKAASKSSDMMTLGSLLSLGRPAFYQQDIQKNYSQAWSFVYFLLNDPTQKQNHTMDAVMGAIRLGDDPMKALALASNCSLQDLQSQWYAFVNTL